MSVENGRNGKSLSELLSEVRQLTENFGILNVSFSRFFNERRDAMRKVMLTMCLVVIVGSLSASAAIDTAWFRFEEGSAGSNIGTLTNSGGGTDEPSSTGVGVDLHSADGLQPVYTNQVPGPQIQDGVGGTIYSNSLADNTPKTNYSTGNDHGSGYIDLRGYTSGSHTGFSLNGWSAATIECFYKVPDEATLTQAQNNWQRVWHFAPQSRASGKSGFYAEVRHEPGGNMAFLVGNYSTQRQVNYTGFTAGVWHHIAMVITGDNADNLPAGYETNKIYAYIDYNLIGSADAVNGVDNANRGWISNFPWWGNNQWNLRDNTTAMADFDEIRITYNSHGTHDGAAALAPDQFLRAVPEPATIGLIGLGVLGLIRRRK